MLRKKGVAEKIKTHILCLLWDNLEEYGKARQVTDGNMAHAHCLLDT
jgi:hypothetical protein